jgi:hypothetical protein
MSRDQIIAIRRSDAAEIRAAGVVALCLYGSASADRMREESDIDLFADVDYARFGFVSYIVYAPARSIGTAPWQTGRFHDAKRPASGHQIVHRELGREGL